MSDKKYYVLSDDNCRYEGMTKEQVIAAIQEAITTGTIPDVDAAVITKIKEQNKQKALSFWVGTQAEYNNIEQKADNCFYIISNSGSFAELKEKVEENSESLNNLNNNIDDIKDEINTEIAKNNAIVQEIVKKSGAIVEEYHDDNTHYFKFSNGLEIELGSYQKLDNYSGNYVGVSLVKIKNAIWFDIDLDNASRDIVYLDKMITDTKTILVSARKIIDGIIQDEHYYLGTIYGSYIAFGYSTSN